VEARVMISGEIRFHHHPLDNLCKEVGVNLRRVIGINLNKAVGSNHLRKVDGAAEFNRVTKIKVVGTSLNKEVGELRRIRVPGSNHHNREVGSNNHLYSKEGGVDNRNRMNGGSRNKDGLVSKVDSVTKWLSTGFSKETLRQYSKSSKKRVPVMVTTTIFLEVGSKIRRKDNSTLLLGPMSISRHSSINKWSFCNPHQCNRRLNS
jgi:hypothetical protein